MKKNLIKGDSDILMHQLSKDTKFMVGLTALGITSALMGGLINMFGLGEKPDRKQIATGVLELVFESMEKDIDEARKENMKLRDKIIALEKQNKDLEKLVLKDTKKKR